jgi:hypothetical protein
MVKWMTIFMAGNSFQNKWRRWIVNVLQKKIILRMCFYFIGWLYRPITLFLLIGGFSLNLAAWLCHMNQFVSLFMGFIGIMSFMGGMSFRSCVKRLYEHHICQGDYISCSDVMYELLDVFEHDHDPNYYSNISSIGMCFLIILNLIGYVCKVIEIRGI